MRQEYYVLERMSQSVAHRKGAVAEEGSGALPSGLPYKIRPTVAECGELMINCIFFPHKGIMRQ